MTRMANLRHSGQATALPERGITSLVATILEADKQQVATRIVRRHAASC